MGMKRDLGILNYSQSLVLQFNYPVTYSYASKRILPIKAQIRTFLSPPHR